MGVFDSFFGGGGDPEVELVSTLSPAQQRTLNRLLYPYFESADPLEDYLGPEYEGALSAQPGTLEAMSLAALEERAKSLLGEGPSPAIAEGETALTRALRADPTEWEEFFRTSIQEPLLQEFEEDITPRISRRYAPSGFYGSERLRADEQAREDLLGAITRGRAETGFRARESALDRALRAVGQVPGFEAARIGGQINPALALFQAGGAERAQRQAELDRAYQDFIRRVGARDTLVDQMIRTLGIDTMQPIVTPGGAGTDFGGLAAFGSTAMDFWDWL